MPYFVNCPRCNDDNSYKNLGKPCTKCEGMGRDWRDDSELESSYHSWAGISIDALKSCKVHKITRYKKESTFTYAEQIPTCTMKEEIEQIRTSLGIVEPEAVSQIFCTHIWVTDTVENIEVCEACKKTRVLENPISSSQPLNYNKNLHDTQYYFPNRCYSCKEYSNTRSDNGNPISGEDIVYCNIGGEVRAEDGCGKFIPDNTAECGGRGMGSCWNYSKSYDGEKEVIHCDIRGKLTSLENGYCSDHIAKERTDVEIPPIENSLNKSKALFGTLEYPRNPDIRGVILDAMKECGIRMVSKEEFSFNKRCKTCLHESPTIQDLGKCNYHKVPLLCYTGDNPYGYDEEICRYYKNKSLLEIIKFPKIYVDVLGSEIIDISPDYTLHLNNMYCEIFEVKSNKLLAKFDYLDKAPNFVQYNDSDNCIDLYFFDEEHPQKLDPQNCGAFTETKVKEKIWGDVSDNELFSAIDKVKMDQRNSQIFEGTRNKNCENCYHVYRDSLYPSGSPTGLVCSKKNVFVTANAICDIFSSNHPTDCQ